MKLFADEKNFNFGASQVTVRFEKCNRHEPDLVDDILRIDLQTFAEPTFSNHSARSLVEHGMVYALRTNDERIGTCVTMRTWDKPDEALLLSMGILPGWRGHGLGQFFIRAVLRALTRDGLRAATLQVGEHNRRAVMLYKEIGFETMAHAAPQDRTTRSVLCMRIGLSDTVPVPVGVGAHGT
jgi:ribosomal protein S18 acetylase RimI-like enzyme